jgi:hypothetical protein
MTLANLFRSIFSGAIVNRLIFSSGVFLTMFVTTVFAQQPAAKLAVESPRKVFYRGEDALVTVSLDNAEGLQGATVEATSQELISASADVPEAPAGEKALVTLKIPTKALKSGRGYPLTITLKKGDQVLGTVNHSLVVLRAPQPKRFDVWLWSNGGPVEKFYDDHGFTSAGGPVYPYSDQPAEKQVSTYLQPSMEETMQRRIDASIFPHNGLWERDFTLNPPPAGDDIRYKGAGRNGEQYYNPFHPEVAKLQNQANELMMQAVKDYPSLKFAFVGMEWVDDLWEANTNVGGLELMQKELGFTKEEIGEVKFVAPGVIPDDDRTYAYFKYVYKKGNGTALVCQRVADVVHKYRPDVQVLADPFRTAALYDIYPGLDLIETWTYTNPDPKLILYVDTLIAAGKPSGQNPLQVITLLNYAGAIAPEEIGWTLMGPDRAKETTWIVLSRAVSIVGYYYSSMCDPVKYKDETFRVPPETSLAIKEMSDKVLKPYGPMIRQLERSPRKIALLNSASSRVHSRSPGLLGYPNEQILHFQSVLEMAHLNTDIVFDETIERYGLDEYDVLVMPKCDVLTQTVYDKIAAFQKRGGILISDQYLGPEFSNVIRFDFDFTYRNKVNANAILTSKMHVGTGSDDHIKPGTTEMQEAKGVSAEDDKLIMESYAKQLSQTLAGKVDPVVWADQPTVLFNLTEKNGVKYLFVVNDNRAYGERVGQYKAMLEDVVPQDVTVRMKGQAEGVVAYDMLEKKELPVNLADGVTSFNVSLNDLGGTIIALYPAKLAGLAVEAPASAKVGEASKLRFTLTDAAGKSPAGLQPIQVEIKDPEGNVSEYSEYHCAENGVLEIDFLPAINDALGAWSIAATDLTAGNTASASVKVEN